MNLKRGIIIFILFSTVVTMLTFGAVTWNSNPASPNSILTYSLLQELYDNIKSLTDYIESDASGNIGIGDVTADDPSAKLDIYTGTLRVRDMAGCSGRLITDASGVVQCNTDAVLTTETDPEVGDVSTADLWCRSDGDSVECDQPNPIGSGGAPFSVMYLRAIESDIPATCPTGWTQADIQIEHASAAANGGGFSIMKNYVRTCFTSDKCSVMYLRAIESDIPATCPSGWTQADIQIEHASAAANGGGFSIRKNYVRTCFICS
jgi:hypothetical protein